MTLLPEELATITSLANTLGSTSLADQLNDAYYEGVQRLAVLGLAVPPDLQRFATIVNWPALVVDSVAERIKVKSFILPGQFLADPGLREGWDANNMDSEDLLRLNDKLVYGRAFVTVGSNEDDPSVPRISVESPREMSVQIDPRTQKVVSALRLYGGNDPLVVGGVQQPSYATLYLPDVTVWLERDANAGRWYETDRDEHRLGTVPVVPFINRRRTGRWCGVSEMQRAISLTDAAARTLTNLQLAQETHAVPQRYVLGLTKGDFVDQDGNPLPVWQAYFSGIWATANKDASVGQFSASDLRNFHDTVNFYGRLLAGIYGLPTQYTGQQSDNPSSAEAIREGKEGLILRAEQHMAADGDGLAKVMALYMRFRDGVWPAGNRIKTEFYDPATPTLSSKADAIMKLNGGAPILSREGSWDALDWNEAQKERERENFDREATDPAFAALTDALSKSTGVPASGN